MMMVMTATAAYRLCQILQIGELTGLGRVCKISRQLCQLPRGARVTVRLSRLGRALEVRCDLFRYLFVFGGIGLL